MKNLGYILISIILVCASARAELEDDLNSPLWANKAEPAAVSEEPSETIKAINFGHNVSQTARVLKPGRVTFGTQLLAVGLSKSSTLASSPWLMNSYNMYNLFLRHRYQQDDHSETAVQLAWFKTFKRGESEIRNFAKQLEEDTGQKLSDLELDSYCTTYQCYRGYQMHALWAYWIRSVNFSSFHTVHYNLQLAYYEDDKKPFSLRRPQVHLSPWQANASILNELKISDQTLILAEIGCLGIGEAFPAMHAGLSFGVRSLHWAFQFGASATGWLHAWFDAAHRKDYGYALVFQTASGYERKVSREQSQDDFSIHPEMFLQYYF